MATRQDQRARLSLKGGFNGYNPHSTASNESPVAGPGAPLRSTNGIIFPFTPNISIAHTVDYTMYDVVHANYQQNSYIRTRNPSIQLTGVFASQTEEEAKYTIGAMHFLRVVSKMNWGAGDRYAGAPPPVLNFSAYGAYNFNKVPVVVSGFNFIYKDGVDYVEVNSNGGTIQLPVLTTVSIDLLPHYSPAMQRKFSLGEFASGAGYKKGFI